MSQSRSVHRLALAAAVATLTVIATAVAPLSASDAQARVPHVWRVGTWHGIRGNVSSIGAAVRKAKPGDWILSRPATTTCVWTTTRSAAARTRQG